MLTTVEEERTIAMVVEDVIIMVRVEVGVGTVGASRIGTATVRGKKNGYHASK